MKAWGYGAGYRYPHDFTGSLEQGAASGLPERLRGRTYVEPGPHGWEADAVQRLRRARRGTGEGS
jgi:replication-associated recombination protein RarA